MEPFILERANHPISRRDIHPNVLKVLYRLVGTGHAAYLVGGGVRDLMLGRLPKDFDVATSAHPHQVRELFRNSRLIGRRFRLVHVFFGPQNVEVATFRRAGNGAEAGAIAASEGDGVAGTLRATSGQGPADATGQTDVLIRHDNTFGTAEEDAYRRDFTVNALFYDPTTFHVIDYVGGVRDLRACLIRSIGEPELKMREDPVRMIRAMRFAAKLEFEIETATREAIIRHHGEILKAAPARVVEEIYRTLTVPEADRALILLEQFGLLADLIPGLSAHLKATGPRPEKTATARNLNALGQMIVRGESIPTRGFVLACLFLDLHRARHNRPTSRRHDELREELRARGFPRGDTEHMRLLLDAFDLFVTPSRRARRLMRRPYFVEAWQLYNLFGGYYGADPARLEQLMAGDHGHHVPGGGGASPAGEAPRGPRRRRRHRRGGRRHRGRRERMRHPAAAAVSAAAADNGVPGDASLSAGAGVTLAGAPDAPAHPSQRG